MPSPGTARAFDGLNTRVIATIAAIAAGDWTIAAWIYTTGAGEGNGGQIVNVNSSGTPSQLLRINDVSRAVECRQRLSTNAATITSSVLPLNQWTCIIGTYRNADLKCRVYWGDATTAIAEQAYGTQTAGTISRINDTTANIGNNPTFTATWAGGLSSVIIDDGREWSLAEMEHFRRTGRPASLLTVRGWWPLYGTAGDTKEIELSGRSPAGSVGGSAGSMAPPPLWTPRVERSARRLRVRV